MWTAPNLLSALRFLAAPILAYSAWRGRPGLFLAVLCLAFVSDMADGWLARRLGQTSELGARLDTAADAVTFVTVPLCGWWLWPDRVRPEAPFLLALAISYASPIAFGLLKYGRLTNHHTWAGRLSACLLALSGAVLIAGGPPWLFRLAVVVVVVADVEELAITAVMPRWRASVPTLWHAMRQRT